jgi:hypothetical protein
LVEVALGDDDISQIHFKSWRHLNSKRNGSNNFNIPPSCSPNGYLFSLGDLQAVSLSPHTSD